ncbi:unnamed protein product [Paramecium pentaurelia]|uniref:non-specific serine/threonine protein kinase n=1 Tax=Paramecium pentaurelia TaxID=43138 RepID=A0A8S1UWW0_9CILI|nr:unnamed protein product [Paramecium pentaurelia]
MQKTNFKNLKDLLQNKYAYQEATSNSRTSSIAEVLQNLKKNKDQTPVSIMKEEIINFTKAIGFGIQAPSSKSKSKEKQALPKSIDKKPILSNVAPQSKGNSRKNSSQSRNTSAHSIINENTNRSIAKDPKIPKGFQTGRLRERSEMNSILDQQKIKILNQSQDQQKQNLNNSNVSKQGTIDLVNLLKQQQNQKQQSINETINESKTFGEEFCGLNKGHFIYNYVIGKGGFGKVWKVELKKNRQMFAMKEMMKSKIIAKRSINSVMNEKELLSQLRHPFLVNMCYAFQDRDNLYLIMDLLTGGDLRFHIGKMKRFKEHQTKFFMACIVSGLEYLHNNNIIHRDIKPENIVLDKRGYARITDLGIARKVRPDNSQDTSGTPGYMAPEVMCRQNHGIAVDYFALGVIAYEFMIGKRPYNGKSRKEIRDQILAKQASIKKEDLPNGWSIEAMDFVNKLLQRKPQNRLGFNGPSEVKNHPWLKGVPWEKLYNKTIEAPYLPINVEDMYRQQISDDGEESQDELIKENQLLLRKNSVQNLFAGYGYDCNQDPTYKGTRSTASTHNTSQQNETIKF